MILLERGLDGSDGGTKEPPAPIVLPGDTTIGNAFAAYRRATYRDVDLTIDGSKLAPSDPTIKVGDKFVCKGIWVPSFLAHDGVVQVTGFDGDFVDLTWSLPDGERPDLVAAADRRLCALLSKQKFLAYFSPNAINGLNEQRQPVRAMALLAQDKTTARILTTMDRWSDSLVERVAGLETGRVGDELGLDGKWAAPSNPPPRPPSEWDNATLQAKCAEQSLVLAQNSAAYRRLSETVSKLETALGDERRLRAMAETAKQEADAEIGRLVRAARGRR